jgi:serine/threonine-protein kinase
VAAWVTSSVVALARQAGSPPPPPPPRRRSRRSKPDTLPPETRIRGWRVERLLGRGGMSSVYAVVHTGFGKRAALKIAHRSSIGERFSPDMFLREARTVHTVDHPGVPDVFATGTFDGRPFLVMERLAGQTLAQRMRIEAIARGEAIDLLLALCEIVGVAHAAGVVHRDLKLDNAFLVDNGRIKLLDWGFAHHMGEVDPLKGLIAGTLTYVAPEQVRGEDVTPATDIYSLGVIAYQLVTGQPPFSASDDMALVEMHLSAPPPAPSTFAPHTPRALGALLVQMIAKSPANRPALDDIAATLAEARPRRRRHSWIRVALGLATGAALLSAFH